MTTDKFGDDFQNNPSQKLYFANISEVDKNYAKNVKKYNVDNFYVLLDRIRNNRQEVKNYKQYFMIFCKTIDEIVLFLKRMEKYGNASDLELDSNIHLLVNIFVMDLL